MFRHSQIANVKNNSSGCTALLQNGSKKDHLTFGIEKKIDS